MGIKSAHALWIAVVLTYVSPMSFAQSVGRISKVNQDQTQVVVSTSRALKKGDRLMASRNCALVVTKAQGKRALAHTNSCTDTDHLQVGRKVAAVDANVIQQDVAGIDEDAARYRHWRASVLLPLGSSNIEMSYAGGKQSGSYSTSGLILGIGYQDRIEGQLGYLAELKLGSLTYREGSASESASAFILAGNALYSLNPQFELVGGINISNLGPNITAGSGVSVSKQSVLGYQLGVDFYLSQAFTLSMMYARYGSDIAISSNGIQQNIEFYSSGLFLSGAYRF